MTDLLRSILQTAHSAHAAPPAVKTEAQPLNSIQVPPSACTAGVTAEAQRVIKLEAAADAAMTIIPTADASKAQRAARRDAVNARRETKRKTMGDAVEVAAVAASAATATASVLSTTDGSPESPEKSKKMKTGKTTSVAVSADAKKDAALFAGADIDALGEERLRAMEAQLESLDPDSKEAKKKRRLIRNRMSAQLHRERKKAYVGQLEDQLLEKERELKALQEKMNAIVLENSQMKQKLEVHTAVVKPVAAPPATIVQIEDDVAIKTEPVADAFDASLAAAAASLSKENWADCFPNLAEDAEMADVGADELLRDLDQPFAAYTASLMNKPQQPPSHHEIHAAKKNFVMMMGMMFSATVFGNAPHLVDVQNGSKFQSFFDAHAPKEFPQLDIASKIMSTLEKTSWKDFRDISAWTTAMDVVKTADADSDDEEEDEEEAKAQVGVDAAVADTVEEEEQENAAAAAAASPSSFASSPSPSLSAASDMTDSSESCDSPGRHDVDDCLGLSGFETDLIDEFEYPVDDPFAPTLADMKWFGDETVDFGHLEEAKDTGAE